MRNLSFAQCVSRLSHFFTLEFLPTNFLERTQKFAVDKLFKFKYIYEIFITKLLFEVQLKLV